MVRSLYYRASYGSYLKSRQGIAHMAEAMLSGLIRKMMREIASHRNSFANLEAERQHLVALVRELPDSARGMSPGETSREQSRMRVGSVVLAGLASAAFILYFGIIASSMVAPVTQGPGRWVEAGLLAAALAFGGMLACERFMEAVFPKKASVSRNEATVRAVMWTLLLGGIEAAVVLLSAAHFSPADAGSMGSWFDYGTLLTALLLPLLGGFVYWDTVRSVDDVKNAAAFRRMEARISEIEATLRRIRAEQQTTFRMQTLEHWNRLQFFMVCREIYNSRNSLSEEPPVPVAQSYDSFEREAERRLQGFLLDADSAVEKIPAAKPRATEEHLTVIRTGYVRPFLTEEEVRMATPAV
jgi:hypothetical protein